MCEWLLCQQSAATQHEHLSHSDILWVVGELESLDWMRSWLCVWIFFLYFFFILCSSGGDESQVALAIVLASNQDCGVYGCTITNEYGTDSTDFLLSIDSKKQHVEKNRNWNLECFTNIKFNLFKVLSVFSLTVMSEILLKDDLEGTFWLNTICIWAFVYTLFLTGFPE